MGVNGQDNLSWQTGHLPLNIVVSLLEQIRSTVNHANAPPANKQGQQLEQPRRRLKLGLDASLVGYKYVHDRSSLEPDGAIELIATALSRLLIDVVIVLDGKERHPSKRATCKRKGDAEKQSIQLLVARSVLQSLLNDGDNSAEGAKKVYDLQTKIRGLENSLKRKLPSNFNKNLQDFVNGYKSEGKGHISIEMAPFQADPCLAQLAVAGDVDAIISGDSDFCVYVGPNGWSGLGDIMLKDFQLTKSDESIKGCKLYTGQQSVADLIEAILSPKLEHSPFDKRDKTFSGRKPGYPAFSGVDDPMVRALIALLVGCDACPGGVSQKGPKAAFSLLKKHSNLSGEALHDKLAAEISSMRGAVVKDKAAVLCLAKSFLYETTNNGYVHGQPPATLERYLAEFKAEDTVLVDGPTTTICKGCSGTSHPFLEAEGTYTCEGCDECLCRFCYMTEAKIAVLDGDRLLCFECMRGALCGMTEQEDESEMRAFLKEKGHTVPATASYVEVLSLFEKEEAGELDIFEDDIRKVKYPLLPTSALHPSQSDLERVKEAPVHQIETLIVDESIPMEDVSGLIHILASLTKVKGRQKGNKLSFRDVLPSNVISMAENARVHTGGRLCKRALRHAMDKGTPDVLEASLTLAKCGDDVCIILAHKILASMKTVQYKSRSAITAMDFLAAECDCKAGDANEGVSNLGANKIICTHCMTEPVQLSQLMFRGFSKHVLACLRRRLRRESVKDALDRESTMQLQDDIIRLVKASGQQAPLLLWNTTPLEMLENYAESTSRTKMSPGEPNVRDLGLLREKVKYCRPEVKAEKLMKGEYEMEAVAGETTADATIPNIPKGTITQDEYKAVLLAMNGLSFLLGQERYKVIVVRDERLVSIGFRLVHLRASDADETMQQQQQVFDYGAQHQQVENVAEEWDIMLSDLPSRREWTKASNILGKRKADATLEEEESPIKKQSQDPYARMKCCVEGCQSNNLNSTLKRVPDFPPALPQNANLKRRMTHRKKCFKRREWMDRLFGSRNYKRRNLRICDKHSMEKVTGKRVSILVECHDGVPDDNTECNDGVPDDNIEQDDGVPDEPDDNIECSDEASAVRVKNFGFAVEPFYAPVHIERQSFHAPPKTQNSGNGNEREIFRLVQNVSKGYSTLSPSAQAALAKEGRESDKENVPKNVESDARDDDDNQWRKPCITIEKLTPKEVKRRTGFQDLYQLLSYNAVVYGGDLREMAKTVTKMTWLEELILYHEVAVGRAKGRIQDFAAEYDCSKKPLLRAIRYRLRKVLDCRERWPMYASYQEDARLRAESWNRHFSPENGHRVVMHDTTNIPLPNPSSGDLNRALHNQYYNMCCAKAGVAVQLCCWIFGLPLVTGHSDDDKQIDDTKILELQKEFAENDATSNIPFLNVFDKGYHKLLEALRQGQLCLRPQDANEEFGGDKVLRTGCIAVVRSGNERGVNRCKTSWFVKRGSKDNQWDIEFLCDMWEAYTFQVNFMYDKFQ